jgi:hypothetical protein
MQRHDAEQLTHNEHTGYDHRALTIPVLGHQNRQQKFTKYKVKTALTSGKAALVPHVRAAALPHAASMATYMQGGCTAISAHS